MIRFVILFFFLPFVCLAQPKAQFTLLNQTSGLRSADVMCFEQDNNEFMWIGTKYGLNVYDGKYFNIYQLSETKIPFNSDISSLQFEGEKMWIGTSGDGLFVFDFQNKRAKKVILNSSNQNVNNINCIEIWERAIWVGTDIGLFRIDSTENTEFFNTGLIEPNITALSANFNYLAVGTNNDGLLHIDNKARVDQTLHGIQINALQWYSSKELIVGTQTTGLVLVSEVEQGFKATDFPLLFENTPPLINEILIDENNHIWVGTDGDGLFKLIFENSTLVKLNNYKHSDKNRNSIASNAVFSLYEDVEGKIWIGTIWKGLNILNQTNTNAEFYFSDFYGNTPYPVLSINKINNELWFGTDGKGLNIVNNEKKTTEHFGTETSLNLASDYIQTIFNDSNGKIWIGTFSSGLIAFDKISGTKKTYQCIKDDKTSISFNDVRTILEGENGELWIATWGGGLNRFHRSTDSFERFVYSEKGEISHLTDNITTICFSDDKKGIWLGTFGNGIFYFDISKKNFKRIPTVDFQALKTLSLYLDNNILWIGTWGNGLKALNTKLNQEEKYSGLNLITTSRITGIIEDNFENLWLSSKEGIYLFNKSENTLLNYGGFNLITNNEFHINSLYKDKDGKIYFGGIEGVVAITPSPSLKTKTLASPVITKLNIYSEDEHFQFLNQTTPKKRIKLAHNQNYFTISYSSPNFTISDVNYSYKMENLKDDWILTSSNQTTFTNISPGEYVFYVRASLNNYQWSEPAKLHLFIAQPIWKRWYSYFTYVAIFTLLLFLFQKYTREREALKSDLKLESHTREKEKELHSLKHRFFTNISHEIRTPVTLILGVANRLIEQGRVQNINKKEVVVLRNSSRHLLNLINELLDFRRLEKDGIQLKVAEGNFVKFIYEIYLSFQTQASTNNIDYRFLSRNQEISLWFDRDQMEKVFYNLISNAFKYTPSGETITVEVDNDDQHAFLKVIDSGKGMKGEQISEIFKRFYQSDNAAEIRKSGFGLGLSIAKEIVLLHGGEIDAANNVQNGICIAIKLPLGNSHFSAEQQLKNFKNSEQIENYIAANESVSSSVSLSDYSDSTLLIVEDNAQILEYIKSLFTDIATIYTAVNGSEGYEIATNKIPDIIVSDVMMPVLDGVSMTKKLKTNVKTSHIPIILLTARTNLIYKKEGFEVGADEYITKPFNETLLRTRVYNLLKSRKQLSEKLLKEYISKPKEELSISTPDQKFLSDLTKIIETNIHENDINAKLISDELCMSHSVIYKKIKALTGLSMIEFIRDFKLNRAAILLSKYQMGVSDVCFKVGFSDRRYFSKLFKAKFEITPSEYAKRNLKK